MSLATLKERFLRLSELVRDEIQPIVLDIATDLLHELEHHRLTMAEIRTILNQMSSKTAIEVASAIDDLWASESVELARRERQLRQDIQNVRDSLDQLERHLTVIDDRLNRHYDVIAHAIARLQPPDES